MSLVWANTSNYFAVNMMIFTMRNISAHTLKQIWSPGACNGRVNSLELRDLMKFNMPVKRKRDVLEPVLESGLFGVGDAVT